MIQTHNLTNRLLPPGVIKEGVVAYCEGSFSFSIIEKNLLIAGGIGYDKRGEILRLTQPSYRVLENTSLVDFNNHKKYYFYLCQEKEVSLLENCEKNVLLEEEIVFCLTTQQQVHGLFVGEVSIDYDADESGHLSIAENAFFPAKNQIDQRGIIKHAFLLPPVTQKQNRQMHEVLFALSESLHQKSMLKGSIGLEPLVNAFFQFSDLLLVTSYSPYALYQKFENNVKLFSWVDFTHYSKEIQTSIQVIETLFSSQKKVYRTAFYYFDIEEEQSFFYQVLYHFKVLIQALKKDETTVPIIRREQDPKEEDSEEVAVFSNVTVIEEGMHEESDNNATVLLNGEYKKSIQVGRGLQSANDIVLGESDKTVSRIHLKITPHKQGFFLEDLSSMGTYVDGMRLEKSVKKFVTSKHRVVLGKKECYLDLSDFKIQALTSA